ncbi:hypothetical protein G3A50_06515 [Ancylobacter pratisalsi]|uniref:Thiol:disulfide interchange protein DsbD N-terminal domain-containing protein n=2 Tax=Ancylobacter pratisalsi TaxID=1745854 RepID=A0A6P1YTA8_9HYPH|nr:hypothetical protein G3A50_06515 [Ancylobacter pratisalsi]
MHRSLPIIATLLATASFGPLTAGGAQAETASEWSAPSGTAVRLLGGPTENGARTAGVEIRLTPGWKTYWRYPGDSGVPPHFDWSGSENLGAVTIRWPAPVRFDEGGSFSVGYKKDVVIPIEVTPVDASKPVTLQLALDFAVCEKICQPANAAVTLDLPAGDGTASPTLADALAHVPVPTAIRSSGTPAVRKVALEDVNGEPSIRVETAVGDADHADLFVEGPDESWALPLPTRENGADGTTVFVLPVDGVPKGADIARTPLRFTLIDGRRAIEVEAPLSAR